MNNVMLDLETMGSGSDAAIIAIGAVEFDILSRSIGDGFYQIITLESSVSQGGVIDPATVLWWLKQSDQARAELQRPGIHIDDALNRFAVWLSNISSGQPQEVCIWGNGAAFDNAILASAYRRVEIPQPWKHWNDRCYRTIKAMHPHTKLQRLGTHHNAQNDALSQTWHLIDMLNPAEATT